MFIKCNAETRAVAASRFRLFCAYHFGRRFTRPVGKSKELEYTVFRGETYLLSIAEACSIRKSLKWFFNFKQRRFIRRNSRFGNYK